MIGRDVLGEHCGLSCDGPTSNGRKREAANTVEDTTIKAATMRLLGTRPPEAATGPGCGRGDRGGQGGRGYNSRGRGAGRETVHAAMIEAALAASNGSKARDARLDVIPGLSLEQVQKLLSLIDTSKLGYETRSGKGP